MKIKRSCRICKQPYQPHPRNAKRNKTWGQKTCGKHECRLAWQRRRWQCWAKLHPGHIRNDGRRAKVRAWAKAYPNYWQGYRATHAQYVTCDKLRRVKAGRRIKVSAKQTAIRQIVVEKLRALDAAKPVEVSAKQTPMLRRMDAMEDCLRSTVEALWSAKQRPIASGVVAAG
jgi:hypothetical protein